MKELRVIDLFCGAGLFSAGFQRAGMKIILGIDNNRKYLTSFGLNFPNSMIWEIDLMEVDSLPECDIIIGSPPCQPFSLANRNQDHEKGLPLVFKFIELCKRSKVKYWIMEEVPQVKPYIINSVDRSEIWDCSKFGSRNLRPRLFAGNFPDPQSLYRPFNEPEPTLTASEHELSIREMKDLQGIPSWMKFNGSDTEIKTQIGNGVPLEVGESLAMGIIHEIENKAISKHEAWHDVTASFYRDRGGIRPYLSIKAEQYCRDCKRSVPKE